MTSHADPLDKASELADMFNRQGIAEVQRRLRVEQIQNEDGSWPLTECVDCDIDIPEARLALGRVRCIDCQQDKEKKQRAYR